MSTIPTVTTKFELLSAFSLHAPTSVSINVNGVRVTVTGIILTLGHEDGSGESFNGRILESATGKTIEGYLGRYK